MITVPDESIIAISTACAVEVVRQQEGLDRVATLVEAYRVAINFSDTNVFPTEDQALTLSGILEPHTRGRYRTTPVTFRTGRGGANAQNLPRIMTMVFENYALAMAAAGTDFENRKTIANEFAHAYLDAHPLVDGNGRTAFVLYNWALGTLLTPHPLPHWNW